LRVSPSFVSVCNTLFNFPGIRASSICMQPSLPTTTDECTRTQYPIMLLLCFDYIDYLSECEIYLSTKKYTTKIFVQFSRQQLGISKRIFNNNIFCRHICK